MAKEYKELTLVKITIGDEISTVKFFALRPDGETLKNLRKSAEISSIMKVEEMGVVLVEENT